MKPDKFDILFFVAVVALLLVLVSIVTMQS
jgi:hypothetical protein